MKQLFSRICLLLLCFTVLTLSGCDLFGEDEKVDELGWKKSSMSSKVKGVWYMNEVKFFEVSSKIIDLDNREWVVMSVHKKDDETRVIVESGIERRAFYFRNIHDESIEVSIGYIAYTIYDAKTADRIEWLELRK